MLIERFSQTNTTLCATSRLSYVWSNALRGLIDLYPHLQPELERPLGTYDSCLLEAIAIRIVKLETNWTSDTPKSIRTRELPSYHLHSLLPGGRWMLAAMCGEKPLKDSVLRPQCAGARPARSLANHRSRRAVRNPRHGRRTARHGAYIVRCIARLGLLSFRQRFVLPTPNPSALPTHCAPLQAQCSTPCGASPHIAIVTGSPRHAFRRLNRIVGCVGASAHATGCWRKSRPGQHQIFMYSSGLNAPTPCITRQC